MESPWTLGQTFDSSNGQIAWDRLGSGPPVVLLHGTPFSSYVWREVAEALGQDHTVYVWDMPGFGQSQKFDGQDVSLPGQQRVFTELLDHWGLESPAVVAHDIGGAIALRTTLLGGVPFDRLALVDAVAVQPWGSPFYRLVNEGSDVLAALPPQMHEAVVRSYISGATHRELRTEVRETLVEPWLGERGQPAFYRQITQADLRDTDAAEARLDTLAMPVTVIWGAEDAWIPPERAERLARTIPNAELHILRDSGHLVQEDAPARVSALLRSFLGT
ncbi:alpha/beta hydrolase [Spiractinospora alimapuensis]|uniref:alpha/beta fold hydrolase n=1 Tax=Spiractinospora alimapuensis TaxID=2820884 RepID=UPI001F2F9202|nr:alpha/beta hydrolase [Spiractinospora alimapuensis]QVQ52682.1 alpha/beta hydrolase [Spiractinospora alimapuensis]